MTKQQIREKILDMRRGLTSKYIEDESGKIYERLTEGGILNNVKKVLVYSDFDNEVKTAALTGWMIFHGIQVYLPCIYKKEMFAADIKSARLEMSKYGIAQPKFCDASLAEPEEIDVVIVPGVAFDKNKNRIGFGCGYYDSFLKKAKNVKKIAIAYDFQLVDFIPIEAHDVCMDMIVLPDGVVK
ncbi:MAG: 5-formyltetrahydrofolate cyclo-ligase [Christensenella sp.]